MGKFGEVQFSRIGDLLIFRGSNFMDAYKHASTCLYNRAYFTCLMFVVHESTVKTVTGSLESFPLYNYFIIIDNM